MRRSHRGAGIVVPFMVALAACGDDEVTPTDAAVVVDAQAIDTPTCARRWTVAADAGSGATITGGALVLSGTNLTGSAVEVYQDGLTGDFDVSFAVEAFTAGGTGAFVQAAIAEPIAQPTRILSTAFGTFPAVGVSAADQPGGPTDVQATATTTGTLRFARAGTTVTLTATAGATTATVSATAFATQPLRVGVQLGSNMGVVAAATTARLSTFTVASGTGVGADTFDCDSLNP